MLQKLELISTSTPEMSHLAPPIHWIGTDVNLILLQIIYKACCALYDDGSWYRGLVVGIQSVDSIEVCTK